MNNPHQMSEIPRLAEEVIMQGNSGKLRACFTYKSGDKVWIDMHGNTNTWDAMEGHGWTGWRYLNEYAGLEECNKELEGQLKTINAMLGEEIPPRGITTTGPLEDSHGAVVGNLADFIDREGRN